MSQGTLQQIAKLDKDLSVLRESWLDSLPNKKEKWMARINEALDERLKLMSKRDSK